MELTWALPYWCDSRHRNYTQQTSAYIHKEYTLAKLYVFMALTGENLLIFPIVSSEMSIAENHRSAWNNNNSDLHHKLNFEISIWIF